MKIFFGSTFMNQEDLKEVGIHHPIKLEYYKVINEDELVKGEKAKFGINVVKTEYQDKETKIENKQLPYLSNDEKKIEEILNVFKEHEVTPVGVQDVLIDFSKKAIFM